MHRKESDCLTQDRRIVMATRQSKKRKGNRQNVRLPSGWIRVADFLFQLINRERTVTQLTEDPNSAFLVPVPSDDQLQNPRFNNNMQANNFSGFNYMHNPNFAPPADSYLPPGQNDLEVLEKLKDTIKNGQHEFFRAVPQPSALSRVYMGSASVVAPHPEQIPPLHSGPSNGAPSGPGDYSRRPRNQSFSTDWDATGGPRKSQSSPSVSILTCMHFHFRNLEPLRYPHHNLKQIVTTTPLMAAT